MGYVDGVGLGKRSVNNVNNVKKVLGSVVTEPALSALRNMGLYVERYGSLGVSSEMKGEDRRLFRVSHLS